MKTISYADGMIVLAETEGEFQAMMDSFVRVGKEFGSMMNTCTMKVMQIGKKDITNISHSTIILEQIVIPICGNLVT